MYVSGLSKNVATGLRVGFVVAPDAWVPGLERAIRATTWSSPGVTTAIACNWLQDGTVARLESEKRRDAAQRQAITGDVLAGLRCVRHPMSYFVWLPLPQEVRADRVAATLGMREGVSVATAEPFASSRPVPHALRVALGSVLQDSLRAALQTVRRVDRRPVPLRARPRARPHGGVCCIALRPAARSPECPTISETLGAYLVLPEIRQIINGR